MRLQKDLRARAAAWVVLLLSATAQATELWPLYEAACGAHGIDPDRCRCVLGAVVEGHGEAAARYVGLEMVLRDEEAATIRDNIGEDRAFAASSRFDVALNQTCTAERVGRLKETYRDAPSGAAAASEAAAAASGSGEPE
ncbi:MAG: hypothetical protein AAGG11_15400 [Pseudomonadota bacterium]